MGTPARCAFFTLLAALLTGCRGSGADVAPVSGRVMLDGQPLAGARIRFQPEATGGSPSYGTTNQDGHYQLGYTREQAGALVGWHTVRIELGGHEGGANSSAPRALPARYNTDSQLREEVKAGENNAINFELTTDTK